MLYFALDLGWTSRVIRTIPCSLSFAANQGFIAFRTGCHKHHRPSHWVPLAFVDTNNFRDNLATLFDHYLVAQMQVEASYDISIMQGSTFYAGTGKLHRLKIGNRGNGTGSTDLVGDRQESGNCLLSLKFIGNRPAGRFGGVSKHFLLLERIYLDDHAIGGNRESETLFVPKFQVIPDLLKIPANGHVFRNPEAPIPCLGQTIEMGDLFHRSSGNGIKVSIQFPGSDN